MRVSRSIHWLTLAGLLFCNAASAATFTVNSTGDSPDANPGDGACDVSATVGLQCTLRAAIQEANATVAADTIKFNIPGPVPAGGVFTIAPTSPLPTLTSNGTLIDGTTQTAFTTNTNAAGPEIVLSGASAGLTSGLRISAAQCVIRSLVVSGFGLSAIEIGGASALNNRVEGCYLGTDHSGTVAVANGFEGVDIVSGARNNTIGGTTATARNVISGNQGDGVLVSGLGTNSNKVQGNYIGTDRTGKAPLPNQTNGVQFFNGPQSNVLGGSVAGARNVLSGNFANGVLCAGANTANNHVQGNFIGTDKNGTAALGNKQFGVFVQNGAHANTIGGTVVEARNLVSGNSFSAILISGTGTDANVVQGNFIGTNAAGTAAIANGGSGVVVGDAKGTIIGGTTAGAGNVISGNPIGVSLAGANGTGNLVQGNKIGTNPAGTAAIANGTGVRLEGSANGNTIGGTVVGSRNLISGNGSGVQISGATNNQVQGNFIGTNAAGTLALPNGSGGVQIFGASGNTIGGTVAGTGNVISGNAGPGVLIFGGLTAGDTKNNVVAGNTIGLRADGAASLPNAADGVSIANGARSNTIGGTTTKARNVISGNDLDGIFISDASTSSNLVQGNTIGLNAAGDAAFGNNLSGVELTGGAQFNTIGGSVAGARNLVSGNARNGVEISGTGTTGNTVAGNFIGTDATGSPTGSAALGNGLLGVDLFRGVVQNFIGDQSNTAGGNRIGFNHSGGVRVRDSAFANSMRRNVIFKNTGLGINLQPGGEANNVVTPNDAGDSDLGPNGLQNFPVLGAVTVAAGVTTIAGTLNTNPNASLTLDFYRNPGGADPSGFGEGEVYVGSKTVITGASGNVSFTFKVTGDFTGQPFTATATDNVSNLNSSEFSKAVAAVAAVSDVASE